MACAHDGAEIRRAAIVDDERGRHLRTLCMICQNYVDTVPAVEDGHVVDTGWFLAPSVYEPPLSDILEQ